MESDANWTDQFLALLRRIRNLGSGQPPFEECGISSAQLGLLEWFASKPRCSLQDAADGLKVTAPNVSVAVRKLEDAGLISRSQDPADGRAWQFEPTGAGMGMLGRVGQYRRDKASMLLWALRPEEQASLLALLRKALDAADEAVRTGGLNFEIRSSGMHPKKSNEENRR